MNSMSISQLKINPSEAIRESLDYPLALKKRNETEAYLVGKKLFEKIISYIEDYLDKKVVSETDFKKGRNFDKVASELGI